MYVVTKDHPYRPPRECDLTQFSVRFHLVPWCTTFTPTVALLLPVFVLDKFTAQNHPPLATFENMRIIGISAEQINFISKPSSLHELASPWLSNEVRETIREGQVTIFHSYFPCMSQESGRDCRLEGSSSQLSNDDGPTMGYATGRQTNGSGGEGCDSIRTCSTKTVVAGML